MRTRAPRFVMGLAVLSLVVGCGGGPRLTRAGFQKRADKECGVLQKASDEFAKAQAPGAQGDDVAKYLRAGADQLRHLVDQIDKLSPPSDMEDDVNQLLTVLRQYADGLDTLAARTGHLQTFQDVLSESAGTVNRLNRLATRATNLVAKLGLVGCVLPS